MKLSIVILLVYGYICHGSDLWYQTDMSLYLMPPFQNVYKIVQQDIIGQLLSVSSHAYSENDQAMASLATTLLCEVNDLMKYVDASIIASNNIRNKVDSKLSTIMNEISIKESEIARTEGQIREINVNVEAKQLQISTAEQSVRDAERWVEDAQNALYRAEQEVEEAKLCAGLIGRRKRFLGNVWNSIQNSVLKPIESAINTAGSAIESAANTVGGAIGSAVNTAGGAIVDNVVKPVCTVINFQQLDNARRNVENKKNELSNSKNQLQTLKNDLNSLQNDLVIYAAQLFNLNYQLNQLKNSLIALPNEQHIILSINQKLIGIANNVRGLFDGSTFFFDAMTKVIDFQSIVQPLNAIYDELENNQFVVSNSGGQISAEQVNQARATLQVINSSLPSVAINMGSMSCSN